MLTYDNTGTTVYYAANDLFAVNADALAIILGGFSPISNGNVWIRVSWTTWATSREVGTIRI